MEQAQELAFQLGKSGATDATFRAQQQADRTSRSQLIGQPTGVGCSKQLLEVYSLGVSSHQTGDFGRPVQ